MINLKTALGKKYYRLNQYINVNQVRVVDEEGKQIGILPTNEALKQAQQKGLDLVEIVPKAKPPICKIIDFKKFRFLEAKKHQADKKKNKKVELKQIRLTPFIAENDLNVRLKRAEKFLKEGHLVKLAVRFRGRQFTKKDFGYQLLKKAVEKLKSFSTVGTEPRFRGRQLEMLLRPVKGGQNEPKKDKSPKTKNQKVNQKKF